jgi:phenylacetate-CoA ligase
MSTQIILKVLAQRHWLRQRDRWMHWQLEESQGRALRLLREHAYERSPFYRHFHKGFTDRSLNDLPVLTKQRSWSTSTSWLLTAPSGSPTSKSTSLP